MQFKYTNKVIVYNLDKEPLAARLASSLLRIFPDGVFGMASINATFRIFLYGATCSHNQTLILNMEFTVTYMIKKKIHR